MRSGIWSTRGSLSLPNQPGDNFIVGCRDLQCLSTAPDPAVERVDFRAPAAFKILQHRTLAIKGRRQHMIEKKTHGVLPQRTIRARCAASRRSETLRR